MYTGAESDYTTMESHEIFAMLKQSKLIHLCFAISFFTSGLIINTIQCILFYGLKPFNKRLYRSIGYYLCYSYFSQIVCLADWWSRSKLYVYIDPDVLKKYIGREHTLLMMNHSYEIDWLMGWIFCEKSRVLGNCKAYAKKVIQYIPAIGWAWKFAEFVFLERSYEKDKEIIGRQINEIFDYPDPAWLLLNAEGTRFTEQKHEACNKFARERGMPELKHHLIPRAKGFQASLPYLKEKCPGLLDIQLVFKKNDEFEPTVANLMLGRPITGYMHVRRIDMKSIPDGEKESAEWLQNLFREKDELQDSFHKYGDFFTGSRFPKVEAVLQEPRLPTLMNTIGWMLVTLLPMSYYLMKLLFSGELLYFSIGAGIILIFHMLMQKTIGMSKISKASSYGSVATTPTH